MTKVANTRRKANTDFTRLLSPWDFPGKSTGVGCPCLLRLASLLFLKTDLLLPHVEHTPGTHRAGPFPVFSLCSMITSSVRPSPLFYTILHHKTLFVVEQILTSPRRMFFKYQFGKQYVYKMDASAPDNLKISLKNGTILYF